jgi:GTP-binding protein
MLCRSFFRFVHTDARAFVDKVKLQVIGGRGGKGVMAFESPAPWKKRPVGGNGGRGGDIILEACASVQDLHFSTYVIRGRSGGDATRNSCMGRAGRTKRIMVPVGSLVKEVRRVYSLEAFEEAWGEAEAGEEAPAAAPGEEEGPSRVLTVRVGEEPLDKLRRRRAGVEPPAPPPLQRTTRAGLQYREETHLLADLSTPGASVVVARGGAPGVGNKGSLLTFSEQKSDALKPHTTGAAGETRMLELELKSIADAGLVGFPNAGKSSLLRACTRAAPRVAAYPFTTLKPHVGTIAYRDAFTLSLADIPGLVEGAAGDCGLGHEFLRHIERAGVLVYVIDAAGRAPAEDLGALQEELRLYKAGLVARPSLVVANKMDVGQGAREGLARLRAATALPVLPVSADTREGVPALLEALRWLAEAAQRETAKRAAGAVGGGGAS